MIVRKASSLEQHLFDVEQDYYTRLVSPYEYDAEVLPLSLLHTAPKERTPHAQRETKGKSRVSAATAKWRNVKLVCEEKSVVENKKTGVKKL